jgi:hypothetical protein
MRQPLGWIGGLLCIALAAAIVWAGTGAEVAVVDETGKVVPAVTQARPMWIPAAVCVNATPGSVLDLPATSPAVPACVTGTNVQRGVLDFADGANLSTQYAYALPTIWTGNIDLRVVWFSSSTSTNSVVWQVQSACVAAGEAIDPTSWNATILAITDANNATANTLNTATGTLVAGTHLTGCAPGEELHLKLFRDSAHASDLLAATARLVGFELMIRLTFN